jgi:hypothetical protein
VVPDDNMITACANLRVRCKQIGHADEYGTEPEYGTEAEHGMALKRAGVDGIDRNRPPGPLKHGPGGSG